MGHCICFSFNLWTCPWSSQPAVAPPRSYRRTAHRTRSTLDKQRARAHLAPPHPHRAGGDGGTETPMKSTMDTTTMKRMRSVMHPTMLRNGCRYGCSMPPTMRQKRRIGTMRVKIGWGWSWREDGGRGVSLCCALRRPWARPRHLITWT